ncbi:MAG: hypothetical protein DYG89_09105 [Caldilinea sp. CFX5]|nr:hypothetical protein [Caldilinea sp. CFX5]
MSQGWERLDPGASYRGWWEVGQSKLPNLPVLAARGLHEGPLVVVTGAVHGDEYEGPAAIHRLFNELDTTTLSGIVIGLPIVNMAAWQARSRVSPLDGVDLNRIFPGSTTGQPTGPSDALAQAVFTTFVRPCDVLVDLHSGGAKLVHLPMIGWYTGDTTAEQLARTFDPALHPWLIPDRAGVLSCEARRAGKVALGAEWGGGARLDNLGVTAYMAGLHRLLATLAGARPELAIDQRAPIAGSYQPVEAAGLFVADVALGATVATGDALGRLYDPLGQMIATVRAEWSGMVAALAHNALLDAGERVAYVG